MTLGARRRLIAAGLAAGLACALAGCGIQPTGIAVVGQAPTVPGASPASSNAPQAAASGQVYIYLLQQQDGAELLEPVVRTVTGTIDQNSVAQILIKGPTADEIKDGFTTEIPDTLVVTPDAKYGDAYILSASLMPQARAQFICTMQELDQSTSIGYLWADGQMTTFNWVACKDTTSQYVNLPGFDSSAYQSGVTAPYLPLGKTPVASSAPTSSD